MFLVNIQYHSVISISMVEGVEKLKALHLLWLRSIICCLEMWIRVSQLHIAITAYTLIANSGSVTFHNRVLRGSLCMLCLMSETQARGNDLILQISCLQVENMMKWAPGLLSGTCWLTMQCLIFYFSILVNNRFILPEETGAKCHKHDSSPDQLQPSSRLIWLSMGPHTDICVTLNHNQYLYNIRALMFWIKICLTYRLTLFTVERHEGEKWKGKNSQ